MGGSGGPSALNPAQKEMKTIQTWEFSHEWVGDIIFDWLLIQLNEYQNDPVMMTHILN